MAETKRKGILLQALSAFALTFAAVLAIFALQGVFTQGRSLLVSDGYVQYYQLTLYYKQILSGARSSVYTFSTGTGMGVLPTVAYYLMSPFNLFYSFIPDGSVQLWMHIFIMIKIALSAMTMYILLASEHDRTPAVLLLAFSFMYAFSENFVLPLSHDEVVHGKCSLISKMPGDYWQKFAGLRSFFGYWMAHPGKKLLFMGGEFAQFSEWNFDDELDWKLLKEFDMHRRMQAYSKALNKFYVDTRAFWQVDFDWNGFQWIDPNDNNNSIVSFIRKAEDRNDFVIVISNFTPEVHTGYRIGVPAKGSYIEVFNSDGEDFGGSGVCNAGEILSQDKPWHNREQSIELTVPPLATIYLRLKRQDGSGVSFPETDAQIEAKGFELSGEKSSAAVAAKTAPKKTTTKKTSKSSSKTAAAPKATKAKAPRKAAARKGTAKTQTEEAVVNA